MNIYCGNLSFKTTAEDLRAAFEAHGEVREAKIIFHFESQKSRGFGFVEMPNKDEAEKAIIELNGQLLDGRELRLEEARPLIRGDRSRVKTPEDSIWR